MRIRRPPPPHPSIPPHSMLPSLPVQVGRWAVLLVIHWVLSAALPAATATPETQLSVLPQSAPLAQADFDPDARLWEIGLHQQIAGLPPRAAMPGFEIHASSLEIGILRGLSFVAADDVPFSLWRRFAIAGHATVGAVYGHSHQGGLTANGFFGNLRGDFGLQLFTEPRGKWRQLCGVFGAGSDYTVMTLTGRGPNANIGASFTYIEGGLQGSYAVSPTCSLGQFLMIRGGVQSTVVHESNKIHSQTRGFYRLFSGSDLAYRWDAAQPANQIALQGSISYSDPVGIALSLGIVLRQGF